jgi:transglutaminase-like putative cysteine protease
MGRRVGQLAGVLAFVLMMGRLGRLFLSGPDEPQWNLILAAATFLGGIAWWLLGQMTTRTGLKIGLFSAGAVLLVFRIMAPETLVFGVLPGTETLGVVGDQLSEALLIIRSGVPPLSTTPGLLGILAVVMWVIGALFAYGSTGGPYAAMFLPSLVMYFQFAVFDRLGAGLGWLMASSLTLGLCVVSMALERREDIGRARDAGGRPMPRRSLNLAAITAGVIAIGAIFVADNASGLISEYGNAPWRGGSGSGYGDGEGGIQYLANAWDVYQGTTYDFLQVVRIESLVTEVAPTAGVPVDIQTAPNADASRNPTEFQVLSDSAILATPGLRRGDEYQVRTLHADRFADLGVLATGDGGQLTPMFAAAAEAGDFPYPAGSADGNATPPPELERYISLPENTPANITNLARAITIDAESDFEAAWMLQSWFRDSGEFTYSTEVDTGHSSLVLEDWLTDRTSPNFRTGYCEQFAAAMGVMARAIDIPTRVVWGFTPGDVEPQADGSERVVVRDRNAHAWVEVWLEPYGWVQFDPTPRREQSGYSAQPASLTAGLDPADFDPDPTTVDPVTEPSIPPGIGDDPTLLDDEATPLAGPGPRWWLIGIVAVIPLLVVVPIYKWGRRRRRLTRIREGDITAAWDEIVDRLEDLGEPLSPMMTPIEAARHTDNALVPLAVRYSSAVYGAREGEGKESDLLEAEWWLDRTYDTPRKARAALSLKSLYRR